MTTVVEPCPLLHVVTALWCAVKTVQTVAYVSCAVSRLIVYPRPYYASCASLMLYALYCTVLHLFPANLGDSACISEIVQAISAVRQFGGRPGMIRQPQFRNWLHCYRITCRLSKIGRKRCMLWCTSHLLCCAVLNCAEQCFVVLHCAVSNCAVLYCMYCAECAVLCCTALCILYCTGHTLPYRSVSCMWVYGIVYVGIRYRVCGSDRSLYAGHLYVGELCQSDSQPSFMQTDQPGTYRRTVPFSVVLRRSVSYCAFQ